MDIIVSNMDSTPIYEQITRQIKAKILGGELQPGETLPSMRLLAKELRQPRLRRSLSRIIHAETEKVPQNLRSADVQRVFPAGKYDRVRANDAG